jgi:hypothetical protein
MTALLPELDHKAQHEEQHAENQEHHEQELRNRRGAGCNAGKTEQAGDQSDHREDQGPLQHDGFLRKRRLN